MCLRRMGHFQLRVKGYRWSTPFTVFSEGIIRVPVEREDGTDQLQLRVQVRSGTKNSRYEVILGQTLSLVLTGKLQLSSSSR